MLIALGPLQVRVLVASHASHQMQGHWRATDDLHRQSSGETGDVSLLSSGERAQAERQRQATNRPRTSGSSLNAGLRCRPSPNNTASSPASKNSAGSALSCAIG